MLHTYLWLFFAYSFLGWVLETVLVAMHRREMVNRGVLAGPLCCRYGIFGAAITLFGGELQQSWFFLLIGCTVIGGFAEWTAGRILEKITGKKWWDYSGERYHLDGYTGLRSALLSGAAGVLCLHFVNPLLRLLAFLMPQTLFHILLLGAVLLLAVDGTWSYCTVLGVQQKLPQTEAVENRLLALTLRLSNWITERTQSRLQRSYPTLKEKAAGKKKAEVFAEGCGFTKLFWLFLIGGFLGDVTETIFCRITMGSWMSRSSVVWGPFSIIWGWAIAVVTLMFYNYRDRSDGALFFAGTVLGGVYEYVCSVLSELLFGQVFWDYSAIPFNLGGRINLLFCFFWGIAAVLWLKKLYPVFSAWIEKIPKKTGHILTVVFVIFMGINMSVSALALHRSGMRAAGVPAQNAVQIWLDEHYGDDVMARIYPKSKMVREK